MSNVECWNCGRSGDFASDCIENWSGDKGSGKSKGGKGKSKGKSKGKGKGKGKLNSVENSYWQEGWLEAETSNREQSEEHAEGWWNVEHDDGWWKDEQTSSSAGWWTGNDQSLWEPEGPVGSFEINSVEQKHTKHDQWRLEWLMLNCKNSAAVTALLVVVAGDLPSFLAECPFLVRGTNN